MERRLVAILYADIADYSRLSGINEEETHQKLSEGLDLLSTMVSKRAGHKLHEAGDAMLAEFPSATTAINAAVEFQTCMRDRNANLPDNERLEFRIGLNVGEVIHDRDDIYGDDVNITARIQELAEPGGICVSGSVFEFVHGKAQHKFEDLGYPNFKNISKLVRVYSLKLFNDASNAQGLFVDTLRPDERLISNGGCLCGEIRYEIAGKDLGTAYCHCRACQKFAGAPLAVGTGFRRHEFRITRGQPAIYKSSLIAERAFCSTCGSSLWTRWFDSGWFYVKTASLDYPEKYRPTKHFCVESQMPWLDIADSLPRLTCEDSPELVNAWNAAGVSIEDSPRNVNIKNPNRNAQ